MRRVVVTGMGLLTSIGNNKETSLNNLINLKSVIKKIEHFDVSDLPAKIAGYLNNNADDHNYFNSEAYLNSRDIKITILHTNDVHSQIDPFPSNHNLYPNKGGFAKRASLFQKLITINPNTLIFDAGDIFQGTPYFNFFQGELELNLMKKMGEVLFRS